MVKLYNFLVKDGTALAVGISAVMLVIFGLGIYFGSSSGGYNLSELTNMEDKSNINCFNSGLWMMYILTIIAVLLMIFGVFFDLFKNFKEGSKSMIGFAGVLVLFVILYFTSSHDTGGRFDAYWSKDFGITEGLSKFISAGLYGLLILSLVSFLLIIFFEIKSFFK